MCSMNSKSMLMIAGIINMIAGVFSPNIFWLYFILGLFLIIFANQSDDDLADSSIIILFIGVILIIPNIISAVLTLLAYSGIRVLKSAKKETSKQETESLREITEQKSVVEKEKIDPEIKRIDILLKLGLFMVLVSGILFATTNWEYITDILKVVFLLVLSFLFFGLSVFSGKKLKLKNTENAYWILGFGFLNFAWIAICYFGLISPWFSYIGNGHSLTYSITYLLLGISFFMIEKKVSSNFIKYSKYISFYLSFYNILVFINLNKLLVLAALSLLTFIINIFNKAKEGALKNLACILSYILWVPLIFNITDNCGLYFTIASVINVINLIYLALDNKDVSDNTIIPVLINLILCICAGTWNLANGKMLLLSIIISILTLVYKGMDKTFAKNYIMTNQFIYTILMMAMFVFKMTNDLLIIEAFIMSIVYFMINLFYSMDEDDKFDNYLQPVSIFLIVKSLEMVMTKELLINVPTFFTFTVLAIIFILIHIISNNKKVQEKYYFSLLIITVLGFVNNFYLLNSINALSICLVSVYIYYINPKGSADIPYIFTFLIYNIYFTLVNTNLITDSALINNFLVIVIYALIMYFVNKQKTLKIINSFIMILPLYNLVNYDAMNYDWHLVCLNILEIYILYIFLSTFVKEKNAKNILATIGIVFFTSLIIFNNSLVIALYIGILGVLLALFGFLNENYKNLFNVGVFITVVNIIYQLRELWTMIPFWLYLLIFGLSLIVFVMVREVKKLDKDKK